MKRKAILVAVSILSCLFLLATAVSAEANGALNWYCVRNKEHKQPTLDANMKFIEELNGYYVDKKHSDDCEEKVVYLTFDAGYENGNIEKILDVMKKEQVTGAFFILGNLIKRNPELVMRMSEEGHIIANHTNSHKDMTKIESKEEFKAELDKLSTLYKNTTGKEMSNYYRPPEGKFDLKSMQYANELGYKTIFWSLAYADWDNNSQPSAEYAKSKIFDNIHNGAIILLHPTSATNAEILSDVIQKLKSDGYRFGSLDELTVNV